MKGRKTPALFLQTSSTYISIPPAIDTSLRDERLFDQLISFALHHDIQGISLGSNISVTHKAIYRYKVKDQEYKLIIDTPDDQPCEITFPNCKQINDVIMGDSESNADRIKQLVQLLRVPLRFYLENIVRLIPHFLYSTDELDKRLKLADERDDQEYRGFSFRSHAYACLSMLTEGNFPPDPIKLLLQFPDLLPYFDVDEQELLSQIADAMGVALIRYMDDECLRDQTKKAALIKCLIDKGANINVIKRGGYPAISTPVSAAVYHNDIDNLTVLIAAGANVNLPEPMMPLMMAAEKGQVEAVKVLLTSPAIDVNCMDKRIAEGYHDAGHCPLMKAIRESIACYDRSDEPYLKVIQLLMNHPNIDINLPSHKGNTPLKLAIDWCHVPVLKIMLESGKLDKEQSKLALEYAAERYDAIKGESRKKSQKFREIIRLLKEACTEENEIRPSLG